MKTMMTVAAGLALGYLLVQYMNGNMKKTTNGRIHRSTKDRKLAGVCGGIAEWLGIDPTVVRLVWLLMTFGWGMGIMSYIACVIALPEEAPGLVLSSFFGFMFDALLSGKRRKRADVEPSAGVI